MVAVGRESPWELRPYDLRQRLNAAEMRAIDRIYPFVEPSSILEDPEGSSYAEWWAAADPDTFRPVREIAAIRRRSRGPTRAERH